MKAHYREKYCGYWVKANVPRLKNPNFAWHTFRIKGVIYKKDSYAFRRAATEFIEKAEIWQKLSD